MVASFATKCDIPKENGGNGTGDGVLNSMITSDPGLDSLARIEMECPAGAGGVVKLPGVRNVWGSDGVMAIGGMNDPLRAGCYT